MFFVGCSAVPLLTENRRYHLPHSLHLLRSSLQQLVFPLFDQVWILLWNASLSLIRGQPPSTASSFLGDKGSSEYQLRQRKEAWWAWQPCLGLCSSLGLVHLSFLPFSFTWGQVLLVIRWLSHFLSGTFSLIKSLHIESCLNFLIFWRPCYMGTCANVGS